jgi:hypothetical protein
VTDYTTANILRGIRKAVFTALPGADEETRAMRLIAFERIADHTVFPMDYLEEDSK